MKALVLGSAVAAVYFAGTVAHAQNNNGNLPFLKPQNGAQVQIPSGWPPGSGDFQARPPTSYTGPGGTLRSKATVSEIEGWIVALLERRIGETRSRVWILPTRSSGRQDAHF